VSATSRHRGGNGHRTYAGILETDMAMPPEFVVEALWPALLWRDLIEARNQHPQWQ
jgi:hypothetical protein